MSAVVSSVSVFFPCLNDSGSILDLARRAHSLLAEIGVPFEIIVVDDGSSDGSPDLLEDLARDLSGLRVIRHLENRGYGGALRTGFAQAAHEWVFYTDGDGQYDVGELADLIRAASADVDWVQGYKRGRSDPLTRKIVGEVYRRVMRFVFGIRVRDVDCDFRLIKRELVPELTVVSGAITVELVRGLQNNGARVVEVPVSHHERRHGRSQFFKVGRVARTFADLARLWPRLVLRSRA
jgi:glycosyltransferase involved in cell wall biosynthesis